MVICDIFFFALPLLSFLDFYHLLKNTLGVLTPGGTVVKNPLAKAEDRRDAGLIPGLGRSLGVGNGNSLKHSCLENSMDRAVWQASAHGVAKGQTGPST